MRKIKQMMLLVAMLAVMVAGAAPQAAFAQQGGAPEGIQAEPGAQAQPGAEAESGAAAEPGAESQPGVEAELEGNDQSAIGGTDLSDQSIAEPGAEAQPGCEAEQGATEGEPGAAADPGVETDPGATEEVPGVEAEPGVTEEEPGCDIQEIIGGTDVRSDSKYPFVAALLNKKGGSTTYERQFCGGTLIDSDSVLTAAHCVDEGKKASSLQVAVGRARLDSKTGQLRDVTRIDIHPYWDPETYEKDIAVLKLNKPVTGISPAGLPTRSGSDFEKPGTLLTIAGWGNTIAQPAGGKAGSAGKDFPDRMQEAQVPVVSDAKARAVYPDYIMERMIAAGKTGKDACQGDSGGPLFKNNVIVGVTSFGAGCGAAGYPGIYAEVSAYYIHEFITNAAAT